uniref:Uncharacterized protein n=1 Tax=Cyanidiococcus yangmingshanensis TaxID=2690220 RepID=A0A7G5VUT1_9RHOD|nr:hypothetical protein I9961_pgp069 [Cyanidiococcus yangmingshanensis]QMX77448.1 hypothetical protein [Cyanidiococcus yangmingshanensis]
MQWFEFLNQWFGKWVYIRDAYDVIEAKWRPPVVTERAYSIPEIIVPDLVWRLRVFRFSKIELLECIDWVFVAYKPNEFYFTEFQHKQRLKCGHAKYDPDNRMITFCWRKNDHQYFKETFYLPSDTVCFSWTCLFSDRRVVLFSFSWSYCHYQNSYPPRPEIWSVLRTRLLLSYEILGQKIKRATQLRQLFFSPMSEMFLNREIAKLYKKKPRA